MKLVAAGVAMVAALRVVYADMADLGYWQAEYIQVDSWHLDGHGAAEPAFVVLNFVEFEEVGFVAACVEQDLAALDCSEE